MLILKQALTECAIQQKAVCKATGFGKSQVSQTLATGRLPADAEKFMNGVYELIAESQRLSDWLKEHRIAASQLFEVVIESGAGLPAPGRSPAERLGELVAAMAGRALIDPELIATEDIARLARTTTFLAHQLTFHAGFAAPEILTEAAHIMQGGAPC
ncbi:MAG TPA: hypothetical protein VF795_11750 [Desulfuromonadaceae bacterium]